MRTGDVALPRPLETLISDVRVLLQRHLQRAVPISLHHQWHPVYDDFHVRFWPLDGARLPTRVQEMEILQPS
jgi:hypothetical protein